jgi:hypothetical protein
MGCLAKSRAVKLAMANAVRHLAGELVRIVAIVVQLEYCAVPVGRQGSTFLRKQRFE